MLSSVAPDHFLSTDLVETLDAIRLLAVITIKFRIKQIHHLIVNLYVTVRILFITNGREPQSNVGSSTPTVDAD